MPYAVTGDADAHAREENAVLALPLEIAQTLATTLLRGIPRLPVSAILAVPEYQRLRCRELRFWRVCGTVRDPTPYRTRGAQKSPGFL